MLDLECGIAKERIEHWLALELALPQNCGNTWAFSRGEASCTITLLELEPRRWAHLSLERCRLMADGDQEALDEFECLFTLRFLSAGG